MENGRGSVHFGRSCGAAPKEFPQRATLFNASWKNLSMSLLPPSACPPRHKRRVVAPQPGRKYWGLMNRPAIVFGVSRSQVSRFWNNENNTLLSFYQEILNNTGHAATFTTV